MSNRDAPFKPSRGVSAVCASDQQRAAVDIRTISTINSNVQYSCQLGERRISIRLLIKEPTNVVDARKLVHLTSSIQGTRLNDHIIHIKKSHVLGTVWAN